MEIYNLDNLIRIKAQQFEGNSKFNSNMIASSNFKDTFKDIYETVMFNCIHVILDTYGDKACYVQGLEYGGIQIVVIDNVNSVQFMVEEDINE